MFKKGDRVEIVDIGSGDGYRSDMKLLIGCTGTITKIVGNEHAYNQISCDIALDVPPEKYKRRDNTIFVFYNVKLKPLVDLIKVGDYVEIINIHKEDRYYKSREHFKGRQGIVKACIAKNANDFGGCLHFLDKLPIDYGDNFYLFFHVAVKKLIGEPAHNLVTWLETYCY